VTPHRMSRTLSLLEQALAMSPNHRGHSAVCSLMGPCYCTNCGQQPPLAAAQLAPPPEAPQTPPTGAQQAQVATAQ
jgi:hypothetical protein